jgi:hypothetical protein
MTFGEAVKVKRPYMMPSYVWHEIAARAKSGDDLGLVQGIPDSGKLATLAGREGWVASTRIATKHPKPFRLRPCFYDLTTHLSR